MNNRLQQERANVPTDPNATLDPAPDPAEDTQDGESQDTAADTQGSSVDWETRYKELQRHSTRREQALTRELELLRSSESDDEPEEEDEEPEPEPQPRQRDRTTDDRLERDSWTLAEQVYGPEALAAYGRGAKLLQRAVTPSDHVAAFEAYHQARLEGAKPKQAAAAAQPKGESPEPRIESNRPDESPEPTDFDRQAEAAMAKGDSRSYISAKLRGLGIR